jgi:DNA-binding NarL/FixJ family response regulator
MSIRKSLPFDCALVVDDHPLVARGIADFLVSKCGFSSAHVASDAGECAEYVEARGLPSFAVVDFWLHGRTALPLMRKFLEPESITRLLVLSGDEDEAIPAKVKQAGAHGHLLKSDPPEVFVEAVTALRAGLEWFPHPDVAIAAAEAPRRDVPVQARDLGLTGRQGEVLDLVLRGMPNKRIATSLGISEQTVKEHVSGILAKLGAANRMEAIDLLRGRRIEK